MMVGIIAVSWSPLPSHAALTLQPIDLPNEVPITCRDSHGQYQPMRDSSFGDATFGSLKAAWAAQDHEAAMFSVNERKGVLRFRDSQPPPDDYSYDVSLHDHSLAITGLSIRQHGHVRRLTGSDVCVQLFDILHR